MRASSCALSATLGSWFVLAGVLAPAATDASAVALSGAVRDAPAAPRVTGADEQDRAAGARRGDGDRKRSRAKERRAARRQRAAARRARALESRRSREAGRPREERVEERARPSAADSADRGSTDGSQTESAAIDPGPATDVDPTSASGSTPAPPDGGADEDDAAAEPGTRAAGGPGSAPETRPATPERPVQPETAGSRRHAEEHERHTARLAEINRLHELALAEGDAELRQRVAEMRRSEAERHARVLARLDRRR